MNNGTKLNSFFFFQIANWIKLNFHAERFLIVKRTFVRIDLQTKLTDPFFLKIVYRMKDTEKILSKIPGI
jgi:hypothetical protein